MVHRVQRMGNVVLNIQSVFHVFLVLSAWAAVGLFLGLMAYLLDVLGLWKVRDIEQPSIRPKAQQEISKRAA